MGWVTRGGPHRPSSFIGAELRLQLERRILDRAPAPDEYLLYPEKIGAESYGGPLAAIWQDRARPLSSTAMHRWWVGCLKRAGIAHRPMHEARHTAIAEFLRRSGNLKSGVARRT